MDRREFLTGIMTLAGGAAAGPLAAHYHGYDTIGSSARMLLSARVASRGSRAFTRGITADIAADIILPRHPSVEAAVFSFGGHLSRHDRQRLERNLSYFADYIAELLDRDEVGYFCSHWHHRRHHDLFEARAHIEKCGVSRKAWKVITHDTDIELIPFVYSDQVTVLAGPKGPQPKSQLRLPEIPNTLRPALSGKEMRVRVRINEYGIASVEEVWSPGISDFVVERAVAQIERTPWAAATAHGHAIDENIRVIFRWET